MSELNNTTDIDKVYAHLGLLTGNVALTAETLPAEQMTVAAGRGRQITKPDRSRTRERAHL